MQTFVDNDNNILNVNVSNRHSILYANIGTRMGNSYDIEKAIVKPDNDIFFHYGLVVLQITFRLSARKSSLTGEYVVYISASKMTVSVKL